MDTLWNAWSIAARGGSQLLDLHFGVVKGKTVGMSSTAVTPEVELDSLEAARAILVAPPADARSAKRAETARRIARCAQQLAADRGYEEFTLDDLAEAAGVSRRTLFNYFPGKLDAVLGEPPQVLRADADAFLEGRPTGRLMPDLSVLVLQMIDDHRASREDLLLMQRCFERNPKLLLSAMGKFRELTAAAQQFVAKREGVAPDSARARVSVTLLAALFDLTINQFAESDEATSIAELYTDNLNLAGQLLRDVR